MNALLDVVARAGERLVAASGGRIEFDPRRALSRSEDLDLADPGRWSPNRHTQLVACRDGWIAVTLAREDDRDLVPAWTGARFDDDPWEAVVASARSRSAGNMVASAIALHLPVSRVGEAVPADRPALRNGAPRDGMILDLSALWAGPYCGALLAEAGHRVVKVESPDRPDPTPRHTPRIDARLNGRKERRSMRLDAETLLPMLAGASVLITSGRPHALARLGLDEVRVFEANPALLWIAITAHGWRGDAAVRVGFGDDCAAAGGLVSWYESGPRFLGDALADPLTGLHAATLALEALAAGQYGLIDIALAPTAARFARAIA